MNIVVFLRPVHHSSLPVSPGSASMVESLQGYHAVANPKDELALEAALTLKDLYPQEVNVTVCSTGLQAAEQILRECLVYNINEAILLEEPGWEPDELITAGHMADFFRSSPFDLALLGTSDTDTGTGQIGCMFSALTGLPYIDSIVDLKLRDSARLEVIRREKQLREKIHVSLPAALGLLRGEPLRYHSFWGKLKAQQSTIRSLAAHRPPWHPSVERKKFTRAKPKTTAMAGSHGQVRSADRIRQAVGMLTSGPASKGDTLIKGKPKETAQKAVDILKKEKLLEQ